MKDVSYWQEKIFLIHAVGPHMLALQNTEIFPTKKTVKTYVHTEWDGTSPLLQVLETVAGWLEMMLNVKLYSDNTVDVTNNDTGACLRETLNTAGLLSPPPPAEQSTTPQKGPPTTPQNSRSADLDRTPLGQARSKVPANRSPPTTNGKAAPPNNRVRFYRQDQIHFVLYKKYWAISPWLVSRIFHGVPHRGYAIGRHPPFHAVIQTRRSVNTKWRMNWDLNHGLRRLNRPLTSALPWVCHTNFSSWICLLNLLSKLARHMLWDLWW